MSKPSMTALLLRPYLPHITALISAIMLGLGVGYMKASTRPPEVDIADNWPLPRWAPYQSAMPWQELVQFELWGKDDRMRAVAEAVESRDGGAWRFVGIVQDGESRLAVIELGQSGGLQRLNTGDDLPNGAEILKIGAGELTFFDDDAETILRLFGTNES